MNKIILDQKNLAKLVKKIRFKELLLWRITHDYYYQYRFVSSSVEKNFPKKYFIITGLNHISRPNRWWSPPKNSSFRMLTITKYDHHNRKVYIEISKQ